LVNPPLGLRERGFLRLFAKPVFRSTLSGESAKRVDDYKRRLFLLEYLQ